jgi:Transmembrane amino acid transporter protein
MDPCMVNNLEDFLRLSRVQHGSRRYFLQAAWNCSQPNSSRRNRSHFAAALFAQELEVIGSIFFVGSDGHVRRLTLSLSILRPYLCRAAHAFFFFNDRAYTAIAMLVRFMDGSYSDGGTLLGQVAKDLVPKFGEKGMEAVFSGNALILVCMLSTAYMAHFNAPKFYRELKNNTMGRYHSVVAWSFGISILLMGTMTTLGFLTFGGACSGLVLNNYAATDLWMSGSRIAVAVSLVFS